MPPPPLSNNHLLDSLLGVYIMDPDHALALIYATRTAEMPTASIATNFSSFDTQLLSSISSGVIDGFLEPPRLLHSVARSVVLSVLDILMVDLPMACGWIFGLMLGSLFIVVLMMLILRPFAEAWQCYIQWKVCSEVQRTLRTSDEFLSEKV